MGFFSDLLGTSKVEVPGIGRVGRQIQDIQLQQLQRGAALQQEIQPFQLAELGFARDAEGNLRRLTQEEITAQQTPQQQLSAQNQALLQQGFGQALQGQLPAGLEQAVALQEARAQRLGTENIARRGGLGGTAEAQLRGRLLQSSILGRANLVGQEQSRLGGLLLGQQGQSANLLAQRQGLLGGQVTSGLPLISAGSGALQPSLQQQRLGFQANVAQQQAQVGVLQGIGQLGGIAAGRAFPLPTA